MLLEVQVDSKMINLELAISEKVKLGRSKTCQILIDESSVSGEHLEISYVGSSLRIRDLESSNGTFRLPNEAPFVEADFSLASPGLDLRLGHKSVVKISWRLKSSEHTVPQDATRTEFLSSQTKISEPTNSQRALNMKSAEGGMKSEDLLVSPSSEHGTITSHSKASKKPVSGYLKFFLLLISSAGVFAFSKLLWLSDLGFVEKIDKAQITGSGLGIDILAVSLSGYSMRGWLVSVICLLVAFVFYWVWIRGVQNKKLRLVICSWTLLVSVWPLVYPFVLALRNGASLNQIKAIQSTRTVLDSDQFTREEKVKKFAELVPVLKGSSYFYSSVMNLFFERVVSDCGGAWTDDWNKKKLCLVLINSVAFEVMSDIRPQMLAPVALRLVLVTSLDSIMRIFPVEGPDSELNSVFIKSIESAGLTEEANQIQSILQNAQLTSSQKLEALQKIKNAVELRIESIYAELKIPDVMRLYPPDNLALGI